VGRSLPAFHFHETDRRNLQRDALTKAGCQKIFEDEIGGTRAERPGLAKALETLWEGDTLVVR
jgi:DNA invertase Pin-like site-specific DNA recombinase